MLIRPPTPRSSGSICATMILRWSLEFGVEHCLPEADTLLVSCTGWRSLEVVEELEDRTGKMVVTANQASIWCLLEQDGLGRSNHRLW